MQGSAEVLADTLSKLSDDKVKLRIIHSGVGAVNESDVLLGTASKAIIIAFNVRPDRNAELIANREGVDIREHSVIYNVTDEMRKAMTGLLEKEHAAYDIAGYRDAPPGLRVWCGATVDAADVADLGPWLDWAYAQTKAA